MRVIIALLFCGLPLSAIAADWPFPESPYLFLGIDSQLKSRNGGLSAFCRDNDSGTSNMGIGQTLIRDGNASLVAQYTHHSCISDTDDLNGYDGLGVMLKINLW